MTTIAEVNALDSAYASAAEFDAAQQDKFICSLYRELQGMDGVSWIASDSLEDGSYRMEVFPQSNTGLWIWKYEEINVNGYPTYAQQGESNDRYTAMREAASFLFEE